MKGAGEEQRMGRNTEERDRRKERRGKVNGVHSATFQY